MNNKGKESATRKIISTIKHILCKKIKNPISLTWKQDKVKKSQEKHNNAIPLEYEEGTVYEEAAVNQGSETEKIPIDPSPNYMVLSERDQHQGVRMSTRARRPPVKLTKDFL
jgi:hypothetical protein